MQADGYTRVRIDGDSAFLTIKGLQVGLTRAEYEYPIPLDDARQLLDSLCDRPLIEKRRYVIDYHGRKWEVDEFMGDNAGLVVAEVELENENDELATPPWVGDEVTHDPRYLNVNLSTRPFTTWDE